MNNQGMNISFWKVVSTSLVCLTLISCAKGPSQRTSEEALILGNSSFNPGETAPGVELEPQASNSILEQSQSAGLASVSIFSAGTSDGGYINFGSPGTSGGSDSGTIPPPGGTTATTIPSAPQTIPDSSSSTTADNTTAPSAGQDSTQVVEPVPNTDVANNDSGQIDSGNTSTVIQPGGVDGGTIPNSGPVTGTDTGSVPDSGSTTGSTPSSQDTVASGTDNGSTPSSQDTVASGTDNGSTPSSQDTVASGTDNGSTPSSQDTVASGTDNGSTPSSQDTVASGTDNGSTPSSPDTVPSTPVADNGNSGGTGTSDPIVPSLPSIPLPVILCHIPPGNETAAHVIIVDANAVNAHLAHGDNVGSCPVSNANNSNNNNNTQSGQTDPSSDATTDDEDLSCPCKLPSHPAHGSCHTNERKLTINLGRVCSMRRSSSKDLFFEEAKHPILSIEAIVPKGRIKYKGKSSNPYANSAVYQQWGVLSVESQTKDRFVIATYDLSDVNLFNRKHTQQEKFNLTALKKQLGRNWSKAAIVASVCEDSNGDGSCYRANRSEFLSVVPAAFKANRIPKQISLDIWSGRGLTQSRNEQSCDKQYSPIVLDLTGEGIKLSGAEEGVQFDLNADNNPVYTGWIKGTNNAFLVRDINGNGKIDNGAELFGSATLLNNGKRAPNGFEAMKELDSNHDGLLTKADSQWSSLRLWFDRNYDAFSQRPEIERLEKYNIQSLNLNYIELLEMDEFGNQTRERSTYNRKIGTKIQPLLMVDVWFRTLVDY